MYKISRILPVAVIITCLFAGVVAASGSMRTAEVKDHEGHLIRNSDVYYWNGKNPSHCKTDNNGKCDKEDDGDEEESGIFDDGYGHYGRCTLKASMSLTKNASPITYTMAGQTIHYTYVIKNTGTVILKPPFKVSDNKTIVSCPQNDLAPGANITCTASYTVTTADVINGSLTNIANATAYNNSKLVQSNKATATVTRESGGQIPEFPSVALPVAAIIGLLFVMRRKI